MIIKILKILQYLNLINRGCTYHKSEIQKDEFYSNLMDMGVFDINFFIEQYDDLTYLERKEFIIFIGNKKVYQYFEDE